MPTKKKRTSKAVVGKGNLKSKVMINWKLLTAVVVVVAAAGGYVLYRSRAHAYNEVWYPGKSSAISWTGGKIITKSDGSKLWQSTAAYQRVTLKVTSVVANQNYCFTQSYATLPASASSSASATGFSSIVKQPTSVSGGFTKYCYRTPASVPSGSTLSMSVWPTQGTLDVWSFTRE